MNHCLTCKAPLAFGPIFCSETCAAEDEKLRELDEPLELLSPRDLDLV